MTDALTRPDETAEAELVATDRCDRCGARAYVRVVLGGGGELLFCGHHAGEYDQKIREMAVQVVDERDRIPA